MELYVPLKIQRVVRCLAQKMGQSNEKIVRDLLKIGLTAFKIEQEKDDQLFFNVGAYPRREIKLNESEKNIKIFFSLPRIPLFGFRWRVSLPNQLADEIKPISYQNTCPWQKAFERLLWSGTIIYLAILGEDSRVVLVENSKETEIVLEEML